MKMRVVSVMLFIGLCWNGHAQQNNNAHNPERSTLTGGVRLRYGGSFRQLDPQQESDIYREARNVEHSASAYSATLLIQRSVTRRLAVQAGAGYSTISYQTRYSDLNWLDDERTHPVRSRTRYTFKFVEVPIDVQYSFPARNFDIVAIAGFGGNAFLERETKLTTTGGDQGTQTVKSDTNFGYRRFNITGSVGAGVQRKISDKTFIMFDSRFCYFFNSVSEGGVSEHPFSYSIGLTAFYKLR